MSLPNNNLRYDNFSVKKEREAISQNKRLLFCFLVIFIIFILPMALVISQSLRIVHLNYQLEELQGELSEISTKNQEIERKVASKKSLSRLETIARDDLNMAEPDEIQRLALIPRDAEVATEEERGVIASLWQGFQNVRAATLE